MSKENKTKKKLFKRRPKEKEKLCQKNRNRKMRTSGNSDRLR